MIFLGYFVYLSNQQGASETERRHGEFHLLVQAESSLEAVEKFRRKIIETRKATEMLEGKCTVFFVQLLEMDTVPTDYPMLLNFKSIAGDPVMPFIRCTVPGENRQVCRIVDWQDNKPEVDGQDENIFMAFDA